MSYIKPEDLGHLDAFDWRVLGHEVKDEDPRVARRRLDLPIPYDKGGITVLANRLSELSERLRKCRQSVEGPRPVIGDAMRLIDAARRGFIDLGKDWDEEYRQLIAPEPLAAPNIEPFRRKARTSE